MQKRKRRHALLPPQSHAIDDQREKRPAKDPVESTKPISVPFFFNITICDHEVGSRVFCARRLFPCAWVASMVGQVV